MTMMSNWGAPMLMAVIRARPSNGVVTTAAEGTPSSEHNTASRKLHDVQAPQSPTPLTITCARASMAARSSLVSEYDAVAFW
jgi:hypothetical protein